MLFVHFDGFSSIGCLTNKCHVGLRSDDRAQALAKDRVIFHAEDADCFQQIQRRVSR